jgi:hypothetical protein
VNLTILSRIQTFREQVLLPALSDIRELLDEPEYNVTLASNAETGINAVDHMLHRMHPGKAYLTQLFSRSAPLEETSASTQIWIGDSLYIEILGESEPAPIRIGEYCLSIEIQILSTESSADPIQIASITGSAILGDKTIEIQRHALEADPSPSDIGAIGTIDSAHIALQFIEHFKAFKTRIPEPTTIHTHHTEAPESALEPIELTATEPHSTLETPPELSKIDPEPTPTPGPAPPQQPAAPILTPQQQLYALKLKAIDLSQQLAPSPHHPLSCKLNPELPTTAQIVALRDPYNRIVTLCLEYSPTITEHALTEQFQRLGHYQHLDHLANQRRFIEDRMQAWLKLYGQPSEGAIAHHLQARIAQQSKTLYHHLYNLAESYLDTLTAQTLQTDLEQATEEQQQEKDLLDALEQNPILGYLDAKLLEQKTPLATINPFTDEQPIALQAQFIRRKGKEPHNTVMLTHIAACQAEAYQAYRQRFPELPQSHFAIRYTLSQKLYPNRSMSIGPAPKPVTPRLELWWDGTAETAPENPFLQMWQLFPALPIQPTQWLLVTVTSETQKLKTVVLADGQIAQEGTKAYLMHSLQLMKQDSDEATRELGTAVSEAVEQSRMRWVYLHQTEGLETGEPRDIVQLQFQLSEPR